MALFPETPLSRCPACEELVRVADPACPHCGAPRARAERATSLVALAAALAVAGCGPLGEPEYGVPLTDSTGAATDANATETTTEATTTATMGTDATDTTATMGTDATDTTAPTTTDATDTGTAGAARSDASEREPRDPPRAR